MSTAEFDGFAGDISAIGPIYPFVGWEWLFTLLGLAFWLAWHCWQMRIENREYREDGEHYVNKGNLDR